MRRECYFRASSQNSEHRVRFGERDFLYMVRIFWRLVDIYHVTTAFDHLTLNMCHSRVALCNVIRIFTEFELDRLIHSLGLQIHHVTL